MNAELLAGALELRTLMTQIRAATDDAFEDIAFEELEGAPDPRDYRALAALVDTALQRAYINAQGHRRDGFLLALGELLSLNVDGCGVSSYSPSAECLK